MAKKTELAISTRKVPTLQELYKDTALAIDRDDLNALLNQDPPASWVKKHPFISNHKYLPIDKVEWLLKRIFKQYRIEVTGQGTAFNGVWVTVRVHYVDPITGGWEYHDGIGACQLQTKKDTSPADLANINNGALSMAFPNAKSIAIKDACDHFGKAFGSDINRKDVISFVQDEKLHDVQKRKEAERLCAHIEKCETIEELQDLYVHVMKIDDGDVHSIYENRMMELTL